MVAWGGDGTVNEAASALVHTGRAARRSCPPDPGNGLAADLAIPFDPRAALAAGGDRPDLEIDAGQVDDCLFFNIAGVGIDAVIAARFAERGCAGAARWLICNSSTIELMRYAAQTYT